MSFEKKFFKICKYFLKNKKYNIMEVPKISKIIINMSLGYRALNKKYFSDSFEEIKKILKQKPLVIKAKKSISEFNIKKGLPIALKITLRKKKIFFFLEKLLKSLPNLKDFEGFSKNSFDYYGNYNFGINDHTIFPEFFDKKKLLEPKGMNITIVLKTRKVEDSYYLLNKLNFPFK
ncbi:large ribosomal subunit protein uL5 [Candidatus Vidania fulgoroideorum]